MLDILATSQWCYTHSEAKFPNLHHTICIFVEDNGTPTQNDLFQLVNMKGFSNDPASGAVQQELYSRMAIWTGQKGLGDGRLYGIMAADVLRMAHISKRGRCFWVMFSLHGGRIVLGPDVTTRLFSRSDPIQDGLWKLFWDLQVHGLVEIYGLIFFKRNSAFLKETCRILVQKEPFQGVFRCAMKSYAGPNFWQYPSRKPLETFHRLVNH